MSPRRWPSSASSRPSEMPARERWTRFSRALAMAADGFHRFGPLDADWPVVRLRAVAKHRSEWVAVADDREYLRVTARTRNQGVELRDRVLGDRIKTKRQQIVRAGDLLVAEIDAKVGGFGLVPHDLDGAVVSSHYF